MELVRLPGELKKKVFSHDHVGMRFSIPEISIQTMVIVPPISSTSSTKSSTTTSSSTSSTSSTSSAKTSEKKIEKMILKQRCDNSRHSTKIVLSIGPFVSYLSSLRDQPSHHHSLLKHVTINIDINAPPPMSGIYYKNDKNKQNQQNQQNQQKLNQSNNTRSSKKEMKQLKMKTNQLNSSQQKDEIKIKISDIQISLTPDSIRPILRLSSSFATHTNLVSAAERTGRILTKTKNGEPIRMWTRKDEKKYISMYKSMIHVPELLDDIEMNETKKECKELEERVSNVQDLLDARHQAWNWILPKAGNKIITGTRASIIRRANRESFLLKPIEELIQSNPFKDKDSSILLFEKDYDMKRLILENQEEEKNGVKENKYYFKISVSKVSLLIGSNAKPKHFVFDISNINVSATTNFASHEINIHLNMIELRDESLMSSSFGHVHRNSNKRIHKMIDFVIKNKQDTVTSGLEDDIRINIQVAAPSVESTDASRSPSITSLEGDQKPMQAPHRHVVVHTLHLRVIAVFDRINTMTALLSDIQVPDYEILLQAPGSAAGKLFFF